MSSSRDEEQGTPATALSAAGALSTESSPIPAAPDDNHGSTPAAWTAVLLCIAGFLLGGAGMVTSVPALAIVGGALAVVSPLVGKVLSAMGLGAAAK